jgi:nitrate reductase gamma subunit
VLSFVQDRLQIIALIFMAAVYAIRIAWLFRFRAYREKSRPEGRPMAGAVYSLANIALPWAMESTRSNPLFYLQFVLFHLGVVAAITATFLIPYAPQWLALKGVVLGFQAVMGAALGIGILRLIRRIRRPAIRLISTPDDFASLSLMIAYFALGIIAVPHRPDQAEGPLIAFFILTAFFLIYVPFSKIGHYLYYPFGRILLGRTLGHRGVLTVRGPKTGSRVDGRRGR